MVWSYENLPSTKLAMIIPSHFIAREKMEISYFSGRVCETGHTYYVHAGHTSDCSPHNSYLLG